MSTRTIFPESNAEGASSTGASSCGASTRTWLFAPGHERHKVEKALQSRADMVVLDWEDAVPRGEKEAARETTLAVLAELTVPALRRVAVRVSSPSAPTYAADAAALQGTPLGGIMVPKVETCETVIEVAALECPLIILLESALGIERAFELASAHPAVRFLAFGPLDLLADLGGHWSREGEETLYARQRVAIAARAARTRGALDGPWPELEDLEGLRADTARGRRMGYVGRMVIHPRQIAVVADAFRPSAEELAFARRVLAAVADGEREGRAALRVDGRFIDAPVVRWAERLLADSAQRDLEAAGLRAGRASTEAGR